MTCMYYTVNTVLCFFFLLLSCCSLKKFLGCVMELANIKQSCMITMVCLGVLYNKFESNMISWCRKTI